jgi:hypothetical protein
VKEQTRLVVLKEARERNEADNEGTVIINLARPRFSPAQLFERHHRELANILRNESRPGVMVFVLEPGAIQGRLWLAATDELRSGSIGRHTCVDLYLPKQSSLSLRHCLVLVRRLDDAVRIHVVDLSSSAGLVTEDLEEVSAMDVDGHFFLLVPGAVLAFFPTGLALPWDPESKDPFASLAPRKISRKPEPPRPRWGGDLHRDDSSTAVVRHGPVELGSETLCLPEEVPAGRLTILSTGGRQQLAVGFSALDCGVVLGRYDRCSGCRALSDETISRVHALLVRRDEGLFLADAGSTNGTWLGDTELTCARFTPKTAYRLGAKATVSWEALD